MIGAERVGPLLVGSVLGLDLAGAFASAPLVARLVRGVAALILFGTIAAVAFRPAFDGYDTDLWTYLLIVERVADGQDVLHHDHFLLEPPGSPHVSLVWLGLGVLRRATGVSALVLVHLLGAASVALLSYSAWRLAARLLGDAYRWPAVVLFWLSLPETWGAVALGRYLSLAFVLLAAEASLDVRGRYPIGRAALGIALAFSTHLFGGVLAVEAVVLVWIAQRGSPDAPRVSRLLATLGGGLVLALPCLAYSLATLGLRRGAAHLWRPEQVEVGSFRMLSLARLPDLVPAAVLALAVVGLLAPSGPAFALARRLAAIGTAAAAVVLFTPVYQLGVSVLGGWMMARAAFLAFPWLAAAVGIAWLVSAGPAAAFRRAVAVVLAGLAGTQAVAREAGEWTDRRFEFRPEAQAEARALRDRLHGQLYLSLDMIGYATATPTLGRPLAVPPGQASPFGDFARRRRRAHRALATNSPGCWSALFELYPDLGYLLTPGPDARIERALWHARLGGIEPEAVRETLGGMGALTPVATGRYFVLDALRPPPAAEGRPSRQGMGEGERCE